MNVVLAEFLHANEAIKLIREKHSDVVDAEAVEILQQNVDMYYQRCLYCSENEQTELIGQMKVMFVQFQERFLAFLPVEKRPIVYAPEVPAGALAKAEGEVSDDEIDALLEEIDALLEDV